MKSIIFLTNKKSESLEIVLDNNDEYLTNPNDIANHFNNFFVPLHLLFNLI